MAECRAVASFIDSWPSLSELALDSARMLGLATAVSRMRECDKTTFVCNTYLLNSE